MSERFTVDFPLPRPPRMDETVTIDDSVRHIDVLLPYPAEAVQDGLRFFNLSWKPLRINRIDERSLVLNDLSGVQMPAGHELPTDIDPAVPYEVMDIYGGAERVFGRHPSANLAQLAILDTFYMSRSHFSIAAQLDEAGLSLHFRDLDSKNGSQLRVHRTLEMVRGIDDIKRPASEAGQLYRA